MIDRKIATIYSLLLIAIFMGFLAAPAIKMFGDKKMTYSLAEKRPLTPFPATPESISQVDSYFSAIGAYLDDHFGFRDFFIYRYQREVRKRFGTVGDETSTHQGIDNWFYFAQSEMLLDFAGKQRLSETEMTGWATNYRAKKQWLEQRGIRYLLVIPPSKQSVYPEFIMESWQNVRGQSKLQQVIDAYPQISTNELLDLASPLKRQKPEPLYYKSDTHWTPFGAYMAYLVIAEKIEQMFPSISFKKDFLFTDLKTRKCSSDKNRCGDLTKMLFDFEPFEESFRKLSKFNKCSQNVSTDYSLTSLPPEVNTPSFTRQCTQANLKAVVFRDSFFVGLEPYVSENFAHVIYLWKRYDQKNVEEILKFFKPDIVIEEVVERNFFLN